jgi:hypothetical protein
MKLLVWIKSHWLAAAATLVVATAPTATATTDFSSPQREASPSLLFPKLRCLLAFRRLGFEIANFDDYPKYFRSSSIAQLAQAGIYEGVSDIEEYVKFAYNGYSPYLLTNVSNVASRRNTVNKVLGYRNGQCEFLTMLKKPVLLNTSITSDVPTFNYVSMVKIFFDFELGYISRVNVYFPVDFLRVFFNVALNSNNTRRFLCDEVMSGPCSQILNQTTDGAVKKCEAALQALPVLEGSLNYFDGNSFGCRALHGAFALTNVKHCAHVSFTPLADYLGRIKCQQGKLASPLDLFSESDQQKFQTFARRRGINAEIGHDSDL